MVGWCHHSPGGIQAIYGALYGLTEAFNAGDVEGNAWRVVIATHFQAPKRGLDGKPQVQQHHESHAPYEASGKAENLTCSEVIRSLAFDGEPQSDKGQGKGGHVSNSGWLVTLHTVYSEDWKNGRTVFDPGPDFLTTIGPRFAPPRTS